MSWHTTAALFAAAWPAVAMAADAHGDGAADNPMAGDLGNVIWTVLIFVVLLTVLGKYAWGPLLAGLQSREQFIKDLIDKAESDRVRQQELLAEYEQKLAAARNEVVAIIEEGRKDAERLRADIVAAANREAEDTRSRVRREIQTARDQALQEIYDAAGKLATDIAGRILQRELKPDDQRRLIEEGLAAYRKN